MSLKKTTTILVSSDEEASRDDLPIENTFRPALRVAMKTEDLNSDFTRSHLVFPKLKQDPGDSSSEGELQVVDDSETSSLPPLASNATPETSSSRSNSALNILPMWSDFPGELNFSFHLSDPTMENNGSVKNSWEYSSSSNQVFIKQDKVLLVHFTFDRTKFRPKTELFIRAVPVYCSTQYMHIPVERCKMHWYDADPSYKAHQSDAICLCGAFDLVGHVVRCVSRKAVYCYNSTSKRHSVLFPISDTGDVLYTFHCQSSCQSGMQRRAIKLVFTLENKNGDVFGRCSVGVKICSCPRRDKIRMERDQGTKGSNRNMSAPPQQELGATALKNRLIASEQVNALPGKRHLANGETKENVVKKLKTELGTVMMLVESIEKRCSQMEEMINWL